MSGGGMGCDACFANGQRVWRQPERRLVELRSTGQPRAAVPTWIVAGETVGPKRPIPRCIRLLLFPRSQQPSQRHQLSNVVGVVVGDQQGFA